MAGYTPFQVIRPILHRGPPPMPVVDRALLGAQPAAVPLRPAFLRDHSVVTTTMRREMRQRREAGQSLRQIADALGVTDPTVRRHTKDIPPPPGGWSRGGQASVIPFDTIAKERKAGATYDQIARKYGLDIGSVWRRFHPADQSQRRTSQAKVVSRTVAQVRSVSGDVAADIRRSSGDGKERNSHSLVKARHIAFWVLARHRGFSITAVGRSLGGFTPSTVRNGLSRVDCVVAHLGNPKCPSINLIRELWKADWSQVPQ